jgi:hypothetical protein
LGIPVPGCAARSRYKARSPCTALSQRVAICAWTFFRKPLFASSVVPFLRDFHYYNKTTLSGPEGNQNLLFCCNVLRLHRHVRCRPPHTQLEMYAMFAMLSKTCRRCTQPCARKQGFGTGLKFLDCHKPKGLVPRVRDNSGMCDFTPNLAANIQEQRVPGWMDLCSSATKQCHNCPAMFHWCRRIDMPHYHHTPRISMCHRHNQTPRMRSPKVKLCQVIAMAIDQGSQTPQSPKHNNTHHRHVPPLQQY